MTRWAFVLLGLFVQFVVAAPGYGAPPQLAVGGRAFSTTLNGQTELWIPLSFLKNLGVETSVLPQKTGLLLRAGRVRRFVPVSVTRSTNAGTSLPLSWLEEALNVRVMRLGDRVYLFPHISQLISVVQTDAGVRFSLSDFAPSELKVTPDGLTLTFFNAQSTLASRQWRWNRGKVATVRLDALDPHQLNVRLAFTTPSTYTLARSESSTGFSFELRVGAPTVPVPTTPVATTTTLSAGVRLGSSQWPTAAGPVEVHSLRVEDVQQRFTLTPLIPRTGLGTLAPLRQLARQDGVAVAINANFFDPASQHTIGVLINEGQLLHEDYARRGALGVDLFGSLHFLNPEAHVQLALNGRTLRPNGINRPVKTDDLVLLTPDYGRALRLTQATTAVRLVGGRVATLRTASRFVPDRTSTWLLATGDKRGVLSGLHVGDAVAFSTTLDPSPFWPLRSAIGAGPTLVRSGKNALDAQAEAFSDAFANARSARSAVGLTRDGTLVLLVALKNERSPGLTLAELARLMLERGAFEALALDGGGSAGLVYRRGSEWHNVGGKRSIAVGLGLIPR